LIGAATQLPAKILTIPIAAVKNPNLTLLNKRRSIVTHSSKSMSQKVLTAAVLHEPAGFSSAADRNVSTLFKTPSFCEEYLRLYDSLLSTWPTKPDQLDRETSFGITHINVIGPRDAPALLLLPGFGANSTMWFSNIGSLSQHFRVYAIDTIGQPGRSIPFKSLEASTTAEWLLELMDTLSLGKPSLAGVSLGGWIVLDFSIKHPDRVKGIALLDPAASFAPMSFTFFLHSLIPIMIYPTRNGLTRYFKWLTRGKATNSQWGELMIRGILHCKPRSPVRAAPFTDAQLRLCATPTLLLVGEKSVIYDPAKAVKRAETFMPNVRSEIIADASHGLNYEQADLINSRLVSFFEETR
jgi:pimeloyl-ACP methyl ester carboxylesterase